MGECKCFTRVTVKSRNRPEKVLVGHIVWRQSDCFGLDVLLANGEFKVYRLSFNKWKITYE